MFIVVFQYNFNLSVICYSTYKFSNLLILFLTVHNSPPHTKRHCIVYGSPKRAATLNLPREKMSHDKVPGLNSNWFLNLPEFIHVKLSEANALGTNGAEAQLGE